MSSGSKRSHSDGAMAESDRRVVPRHFRDRPNPPAGEREGDEATPETAAAPPPLYRHAWESVFSFASLADLHSLMSVCKEWQSAVLSMAPRGFECPLPQSSGSSLAPTSLLSLTLSPLRRHVSTLRIGGGDHLISAEQMNLVRFSMPHLTALTVRLASDASPVQFPPSLRALTLFLFHYRNLPALQQPVDAIARLQHLETLELRFMIGESLPRSVSFAPLSRAAHLTSLRIGALRFTSRQVQQLRMLHQIRRFSLVAYISELSVSALLAPPHQLQLTELDGIGLETEADGAALTTLPSLTTLHLPLIKLRHVEFLHRIPALTSLTLGFNGQARMDAAATARVMVALQSCAQLTHLQLDGQCSFEFTADQLASRLQHMPRLRSLILLNVREVRSLSFVVAGTLPATLISLQLGDCASRIPMAELQRVHELHALQALALSRRTFDSGLSPLVQQLYTPPSRLIPSLQRFSYQ